MSLGFESAGFAIRAAVDSDPIHVETYGRNFADATTLCVDAAKLTGDRVRQAAGLESGEIAVVFGGPPCQGFSVGGRRNREDPRNSLIGEFARLVLELRPRYFVLENVAGILSDPVLEPLMAALDHLERSGYRTVRPIRVLDAADFAVPQRRKRAFILGFRDGLTAPEYPEPVLPAELASAPKVGDAFMDLDSDRTIAADGPMSLSHGYAALMSGAVRAADDRSLPRDRAPLGGMSRVAHSEEIRIRFERTRPGEREPVSRFHRLALDKVAPTLRAGSDRDNGSFTAPRPIHPTEPRCITVREGARLHSLPDWFQLHESKWHGFRQIGNAVPPLLAAAVARQVFSALEASERSIGAG